jgi:hypothetical protein
MIHLRALAVYEGPSPFAADPVLPVEMLVRNEDQQNLDFSEWDQAFPSKPLLASVTLNRHRHNAYCMTLDGQSYRTPRQMPTTVADKTKNLAPQKKFKYGQNPKAKNASLGACIDDNGATGPVDASPPSGQYWIGFNMLVNHY